MSAGDEKYFEIYNPDEDVLWFWYQKWHVEAVTEENESKQSTKRTVRSAIESFDKFLATQKNEQEYNCHWSEIDSDSISYDDIIPPRDVTPQLAEQFLIEIQKHYSADSQQSIYSHLKQAYSWCEKQVESVDLNPFEKVEEKHKNRGNNWILDVPTARNPHIISHQEAQSIVRSWSHPMWVSIQLLVSKLPRRVGGVSNLDLEDVNISHPGCDWTVHDDLRRWPDHIAFRSDKRQSDEGRNTGNKTQTNGVYPIDAELKNALLWYLTIRPQPYSPTDPLFINQRYAGRLSGSSIYNKFVERAKELGYWYGANNDDNLNPHYWRHWGTSHYQSQFGSDDSSGYTALTQYLRGDSKSDIIGLYDNYTEDKRDIILDAMPTFFEPYINH